jgi:hypothetical protein
MIKKGNLHALVQSLSKSEKRYFRLHTAQGDAGYLRLFDFVDKQDVPDDKAIRLHFRNEKFSSQLHVAKIYLAELIMKSLRNYYSKQSALGKTLNLLRDAEILFKKELFDLCRLKLEKAGKIAAKYEFIALQSEILSWKRKLVLVAKGQSKAEMLKITTEESTVINQLLENNSLWRHTIALFNQRADKDFAGRLPKELPSTLQSLTLLRHIEYTLHYINGDVAGAENAVSTLIGHLADQPHRITEDPTAYVTAISNKISILIRQKRWKEIEALIMQMREVPARLKPSASKFTVRLWLRIFNLELEMYRDTKQFTRAGALIREIETFFQEREDSLPADYRIMLYYQVASVYFSKGLFPKSLAWTNKILNHNFNETRNDLQCYARLLNLVVHFELNNIIVLRYSVDNTKRFFRKKKFNNDFATGTLKLFSRLGHVYPDDYSRLFSETYQDLFASQADLSANLDYLDLKYWLESKLKNKSKRSAGKTTG